MTSTSNAQNIEKLNGNNFHTWKRKIEFFLHEKDLWEITSRELLPPKVEFGEIVFKGGTFEYPFVHEEGQIGLWNNSLKCC
jgi:hypothetical protein